MFLSIIIFVLETFAVGHGLIDNNKRERMDREREKVNGQKREKSRKAVSNYLHERVE